MNIETANKLLKLRKENNLSQEDLAEKLGISRQAVSKWERGEASPDTDNLIQLANLYRISLDELLSIDVKTFKNNDFSKSEPSRKTIKLSKDENFKSDPLEYSETGKRIVYPKGSLREEIYPNREASSTPNIKKVEFKSTDNFQRTNNINQDVKKSNTFNPNNYMVANTPTINNQYQGNNFKTKTNSIFNSSNKMADEFEVFMSKNNVTYKWLYAFPFYAVALGLFFLFANILGFGLSWLWFLSIPLYYTTIKCIEKRDPMVFCYPIICLIIFYIQGYIFDGFLGFTTSWLWFLTIPLYYTIIPALKKKNPLIFCYPVLVVMAYLLIGFVFNWTLGLPLFATIPFYYWYFSKRV